jgi:hypothetical protein
VRNAYATYLYLGDNSGKLELIPHKKLMWHHIDFKDLLDKDGHA